MLSQNFLKRYISKIHKVEYSQLVSTFIGLAKDYRTLYSAIDQMEIAIFLLDEQMIPLFFNQCAKRQFSLTRSSSYEPISNIIPISEFSSHIKRWIKEGTIFTREEMVDGASIPKIWDVRFYNTGKTGEEASESKDFSYILTFQDVTTEKKLQERQALQKNIASMQHLAASLAHEIKNPLTAIQLYLNIAGRYAKDLDPSGSGEKILHALSVITQEVERLGGITSDFLTNIRPLSLKITQINPEELMSSLRELIRPILIKENIQLSMAIEENLPSIAGDVTYVRMVLLNVLKNAIESFDTWEGRTGEKRISIKLEENSPFVQITVKDNGCGIDKKLLRNVFDPYVTTKKTGSGIGLSLSHKVVLEHKGDIYLESQRGKGTSVVVLFPSYHGVVHKFLT